MYAQITNKNGEEMYILTCTVTNDLKPYIKEILGLDVKNS